MELFNRYENLVFEALALAVQEASYEDDYAITLDRIDAYFREVMGDNYLRSLSDDEAEKGFFGVFDVQDKDYIPVPSDHDGDPIDLPVLLNTIEKEAIKNALNSPNARCFLDEDELSELQEMFADFTPSWTEEDITLRHRLRPAVELTDKDRELIRRLQQFIIEHRAIYMTNAARTATYENQLVYPLSLEYTYADSLWTLNAWLPEEERSINIRIDRLQSVRPGERYPDGIEEKYKQFLHKQERSVTLQVQPVRHILERMFRMFSFYRRDLTYDRDQNKYTLTLYYYAFDEVALLRTLLSAGPFITVLSPDSMKQRITEEITAVLQKYSDQ